MADFPTSIYSPRTKENRSGVVYDPTKSKQIFAEDIQNLDNEVVAVETFLQSNVGNYNTLAVKADEYTILGSDRILINLWISTKVDLTTVKFPYLEYLDQVVYIESCPLLTSLDLSALVQCLQLNIFSNITLPQVFCPLLVQTGDINIHNLDLMTVLDLTSLATAGYIQIFSNPLLTSLDFSALNVCPSMFINGNETLSDLSISSSCNCLDLRFNDNALSQISVDNILANLDSAGYSTGYIDLRGGTNFTPSGAGLVSKSNLEAKFWTVLIN